MTSASTAEPARFNSQNNTLSIPRVVLSNQTSYAVELVRSQLGGEVIFHLSSAAELPWTGEGEAHFSFESGQLHVPNVEVDGEQRQLKLELVPDSLSFRLVARLVAHKDNLGAVDSVTYWNGAKEEIDYRFGDEGAFSDYLYTESMISLSMIDTNSLAIHFFTAGTTLEFNVAEFNRETLGGIMIPTWQDYNSEVTAGSLGFQPVEFLPSQLNWEFIDSFHLAPSVYSCMRAAVDGVEWESYLAACDSL